MIISNSKMISVVNLKSVFDWLMNAIRKMQTMQRKKTQKTNSAWLSFHFLNFKSFSISFLFLSTIGWLFFRNYFCFYFLPLNFTLTFFYSFATSLVNARNTIKSNDWNEIVKIGREQIIEWGRVKEKGKYEYVVWQRTRWNVQTKD